MDFILLVSLCGVGYWALFISNKELDKMNKIQVIWKIKRKESERKCLWRVSLCWVKAQEKCALRDTGQDSVKTATMSSSSLDRCVFMPSKSWESFHMHILRRDSGMPRLSSQPVWATSSIFYLISPRDTNPIILYGVMKDWCLLQFLQAERGCRPAYWALCPVPLPWVPWLIGCVKERKPIRKQWVSDH